MTTWLEGARPDTGGLLVPGGPHQRGADLTFGSEAMRISHRGNEALLDWEVYRNPTPWGSPSAWRITTWGGAAQGVGLEGPGPLDSIRRSTRTPSVAFAGWNPFNRGRSVHPIVPLWALHRRVWGWDLWEIPAADALCQVLRDRSEAREALADPSAVKRLAHDLTMARREPPPKVAVTPGSREIGSALTSLGYRHRYQRPLPSDEMEDLEAIVAKVREHVRIVRDGQASEQIREAVRRQYMLSPWPFAALGV
jgi:hypothetical protein